MDHSPSLFPPSGILLIIAGETMTRGAKIARHGNGTAADGESIERRLRFLLTETGIEENRHNGCKWINSNSLGCFYAVEVV